ncbi:MAG: hypothetical protein ACKOZU_08700 [Planctomycetaceae bacterium]
MAPSAQSDVRWPWPLKAVASVLIAIYLAAVIVPPLAGPPPATDLARAALAPLRPLVHALGLDHGYRFFAPNPGPGHSIRWTVTRADGTTASGSIPDAAADRPRLLYHRRFMVAEKLAARVPPPDAPAEVRRAARVDWEPLARGVARNLLRATGAASVRLELVEHYLPDPGEVIRGERGADVVTPLGTFARAAGGSP